MQSFSELTPPTAVTHALSLPLLSPSSANLVLAKTSLLQIFTLKTLSTDLDTTLDSHDAPQLTDRRMLDGDGLEQSFLAADLTLQRAERAHNTKLVLVAEYPLSGTVTSLARVKIMHSRTGAEALLVATRDAKLSLVEWDPDAHALSTISIHHYEKDDLHAYPWAPEPDQCVSYLTVDPSSRCAALKFGARNLAILPFHQPGDDLVMGDFDSDDGDAASGAATTRATNGDAPASQTPNSASFVLPLATLDPSLVHVVHLSFLHEYREPTFGILSSPMAVSTTLLHERRDLLAYTVFTLDLEQRASTTILSVTGLPYDLRTVVPLPTPVGGALLVGTNELIHVDQAGKTNGVAVNDFARTCSSFGMADQADLNMRLEGCAVEQLGAENGEMLLVLSTGELAIVSFRLDGRSVSGMAVRRVAGENGGLAVQGAASCTASLGRGRLFVGGYNADSVVLGWSRRTRQATKPKASAGSSDDGQGDTFFDGQDLDEDDYDDDLYAGPVADGRKDSVASLSASTQTGDYAFRVHDSMINLAPMRDFTFGRRALADDAEKNLRDASSEIELITTSGTGRAGGVTVLSRDIDPRVIGRFEFPGATGIWSVSARRSVAKAVTGKANADLDMDYGADEEFDRFMMVSRTSDSGEESAVYAVTATGFEEVKGTEFDPSAGGTVDVGSTDSGTRVVQVLKSEIRSYDGDLGLAQIFPMLDEATDTEHTVASCSFADPYMLVLRDDHGVLVLQSDQSGDLEELDKGDALTELQWMSGCLYRDREAAFTPPLGKEGKEQDGSVLLFLLSTEGSLHVFAVSDLATPVYVAHNIGALPVTFGPGQAAPRTAMQEALAEMIVADVGDAVSKSPLLIARAANDDLTIYEPFFATGEGSDAPFSGLRFAKVSNPHLARATTETSEPGSRLRALTDVAGYSTVFLSGPAPSFVLKSASSAPRVLGMRGKAVQGVSGFNTPGCARGWVHVDVDGAVRVAQFPTDVRYAELGWATKRIPLGEEVHVLTYHEGMGSYVLGTSTPVDFQPPKDDELRERLQEDLAFKPRVSQGAVKLLTPVNWSVVDTYPLPDFEVVQCATTLSLEVSEHTRARKTLVAVGTAMAPLPEQATKGAIYIFEVIRVVPVPGKPETDRKLKLVSREGVKGAVTAITAIGQQGFLVESQGQKVIVRGLKEDNTLLPVAFMDVMCYVSALKTLPQTGLCLIGDAVKGLWLVGYAEDPYKMMLFGKSTTTLEVVAADFLPDGEQLYIVVGDGDGNLHVLQFDPEHPKSLSGTRLLHQSTFSTGAYPSTLTRVPAPSQASGGSESEGHVLLHTSPTGAMSLITPLSEAAYRRLSSLSSILAATLEPTCGLNPRAYRAPSGSGAYSGGGGVGGGVSIASEGFGGRGMVDGCVLRKWNELGAARKAEIAARVGATVDEVRADLAKVAVGAPGGLAYL